MVSSKKIKIEHLLKHETKREVLFKFFVLLFLLGAYTGFLAWKYGAADGGLMALITWSFFVLCTPVADAGFLLDFPLRLLFQVRMIVSEVVVWSIALCSNILLLFLDSGVYDRLLLTRLFKQILLTPYPYWVIILLSFVGTFLSIQFGDELMDLVKHKHCDFQHKHRYKHHFLIMVFLFAFVFLAYGYFIRELGIHIPEA